MVFESTTQRLQELGIDFMAALERVRKVATKTPITYNRNLVLMSMITYLI